VEEREERGRGEEVKGVRQKRIPGNCEKDEENTNKADDLGQPAIFDSNLLRRLQTCHTDVSYMCSLYTYILTDNDLGQPDVCVTLTFCVAYGVALVSRSIKF